MSWSLISRWSPRACAGSAHLAAESLEPLSDPSGEALAGRPGGGVFPAWGGSVPLGLGHLPGDDHRLGWFKVGVRKVRAARQKILAVGPRGRGGVAGRAYHRSHSPPLTRAGRGVSAMVIPAERLRDSCRCHPGRRCAGTPGTERREEIPERGCSPASGPRERLAGLAAARPGPRRGGYQHTAASMFTLLKKMSQQELATWAARAGRDRPVLRSLAEPRDHRAGCEAGSADGPSRPGRPGRAVGDVAPPDTRADLSPTDPHLPWARRRRFAP